ncbi:MAG: CoB--CoM heterodisulfide reductase iron-sulfur subunit A family protein [Chloroflexota bacterium]
MSNEVLVIGGGIAGMQAALDVANTGHKVVLVEKAPSIGGHMLQFSEVFPTLDCPQCIGTPKMTEVSTHPNIELMAYSEVESVTGSIGRFNVKIRKKSRFIDAARCTGCGECAIACPISVPSEWDLALGKRKAAYVPFPQAVPAVYTIDKTACVECRKCEKVCDAAAINFEAEDEFVEREIGAIILATGYEVFDASLKPELGYGTYPNVITGYELERLDQAGGPTGGKIEVNGKEPQNVVFIQCVGSRDKSVGIEYCSRVCCMATAKQAHYVRHKIPGARVTVCYIDIRAFGKRYEEFYERVQGEGVIYRRGVVSEVYKRDDKLVIRAEDTLLGEMYEEEADLVVLAAGIVPGKATAELAEKLNIPLGPDGFFLENHPKLAAVESGVPGIYLAGCCEGSKDISDSVVQAGAAALMALLAVVGAEGEPDKEPVRS